MAGEYFQKFPKFVYNNTVATNIIARVRLKDELKKFLSTYYTYNIKSGERPDNIAENYYKRANLSWLIFIANDIVDPLVQWYKDNESLQEFLISKYGSLENTSKIAYYRVNWASDLTKISQSQFEALSVNRKKYWDRSLSTEQGDETFWATDEDKRDYTKSATYERAKINIYTETNKILKITYTQTSGTDTITNGDIIRRYSGGALVASGEVVDTSTGILILKNIEESGSGFNASNSYSFAVKDKDNVLTVTAREVLADSISDDEFIYWEPVTFLTYETELNDSRSVVTLLDSRYALQAERELRVLLS